MNQEILEGAEIFKGLISEISKAKSEILVASAWFTDPLLFDTLLRKQKKGVSIKLIIADNEENERLDFSKLTEAGGIVYKVKNKGFGMMHEKYCVIDNRIAAHGSYNWTINARNNNQESVIVTNHIETVNKLNQNFIKMEMDINNQTDYPSTARENSFTDSSINVSVAPEQNNKKGILRKLFSNHKDVQSNDSGQSNNTDIPKSEDQSIDEVFEAILSAEIKKTDKEDIKNLGKENAGKVNGDSGVLGIAMDSLYQIFITDNSKVKEKKQVLKSKIEAKTEEIISNYEMDKNRKKSLEEQQYLLKENNHKEQISELIGEKKIKENQIDHIKNHVIPGFKQKIDDIKEAIKELQVEFVKPKIKYHELIPFLIILTGLGVALFLFYSSSAYIMLYAKDDAMEMLKNGLTPIAEVFNSQAMMLASEKGGTAMLYLSFFVFIPLAIAFVAHKGKLPLKIFGILSIILLDIFVAYKVANTINEINYLTNGIQNDAPFYTDINVWLVFILSSMPFIFFTVILSKILDIFESLHPESGKAKADLQIKQHKSSIKAHNTTIQNSSDEIHALETDTIHIENNINSTKEKLSNLELEHPGILDRIESEYNDKTRYLKSKADVYKNNIDNDNVPILIADLKARVSLFLQGWNEWLHEEFSVSRAVEHSEEARIEADKWLNENIEKDNLHSLKKVS